MKRLKNLVSLIGFLGVFYFQNVNATGKDPTMLTENKNENLEKLNKPCKENKEKKCKSNGEDLIPIKVQEGGHGIIFNLSKESESGLYEKECLGNRREIEQWCIDNFVKFDVNCESNHKYNYGLRKIEEVLIRCVDSLSYGLLNQIFDAMEKGYSDSEEGEFIGLIYHLLKGKFSLGCDDLYGFNITKNNLSRKFSNIFIIRFDGISKEEKEKLANMKNKNLEHIRILRKIREFLKFFIDVVFGKNKKEMLPLPKQEYSMKLSVPLEFNSYCKNINDEIKQVVLDNAKVEGTKFNGADKDFDLFYKKSYNKILNMSSEVAKTVSRLMFKDRYGVCLYNPKNIDYVKISDDLSKVTFKFKDNLDVKRQSVYLLEFELMAFKDLTTVIPKQIISIYLERLKETKEEENKKEEYNINECKKGKEGSKEEIIKREEYKNKNKLEELDDIYKVSLFDKLMLYNNKTEKTKEEENKKEEYNINECKKEKEGSKEEIIKREEYKNKNKLEELDDTYKVSLFDKLMLYNNKTEETKEEENKKEEYNINECKKEKEGSKEEIIKREEYKNKNKLEELDDIYKASLFDKLMLYNNKTEETKEEENKKEGEKTEKK